ncbi:MAG: hypothetical protein JSU69_10460, partial [Candidatus Zixiibacteriota bacterium]
TGEEFPLIASSWVDLEGADTYECIIDADRQGTVLYCLPNGITIDSLTIMGGYGDYGGGLHFYYSNATLLDCKITDNESTIRGGGIYCRDGNADIRNNRICRNDCDDEGGGVFFLSSDATIAHCVVDSNHAHTGGGLCILSSSPTVDSCDIKYNDADIGGGIKISSGRTNLSFCTITDNTANLGAGLHTYGDDTFIRNCTFTGNVASSYGGGVYVFSLSDPVAVNTIIWGNLPESIYDKVNGTFTATYCDIEGGWAGTGNIDCDPQFADPQNGDYHLTEGSCCIDAGDPDPQYNDPDGTRADIGAFYFPHEGSYLCGDVWGVLGLHGSPYFVTCDISVPDGAQLTIEPGVELLFQGYYKFNVFGTLKAIGNSEDSIFFTHYFADEDSTWHGIRFYEADAPCSLKYCQVEYGLASGLPPDNCGGAIYAFSSDLHVAYSTITKNKAMHAGGGLYTEVTDLYLYKTLINSNQAIDHDGGGIYYAYHSQSNPVCSLMHCTFTDNLSGGGGECAVFWDYWSPKLNASATAENGSGTAKLSEKGSNPVVLNCIFWDDWPDEIFSKGYSSITYCDVTNGYPGEGNIDCDPVFCDPEAGNYYVIDTSCCVGAGYGGAIIGAFGIGCYAIDCGDVDGSLTVNILDVGSIINYLYRQGVPPLQPTAADVDASGTVNLVDAMHLIKYLYKDGSEPDCRKQLAK